MTMPKITDYSARDILHLQDTLRSVLHDAQSLEHAAQWLAEMFCSEFSESVVLARSFVTIPYKLLPEENQQFVQSLAQQNGVENLLHEETIVLSLLGTSGIKSSWNDRRMSQGHIGIPLISPEFIDSIPMVARLLKELEVDLGALDIPDMSFVERGQAAGWISVFYVQDAATATDHQGRNIIPAQDFVRENGIKTIFGLGGIYADGTIISLLVFTKDAMEREIIEAYTPLVTSIRVATADLVQNKMFFAQRL
jgi:hypothetical protein